MKRDPARQRGLRSGFAKQAVLAFAAGAAAHFLFDALGRWPPAGWIAPVNESLWEHIKMAFWPILIIDGLAGRSLPSIEHRVVCTAISASISALLIFPLFYGYTGVWGEHHLAADIAVFAIAVSSGHWVAYRVALGPVPSTALVVAACTLGLSLGAALIVFTYAPPRLEVFRDSLTNGFGIEG